ncbi:hypothetical protein GGR53DRAFT_469829 [Hypoxylon sp. FL1150]|nr:hypothetical protein GGR53DRAFT_469829 [Hypoxylon sp. FL1150]
MSLVTYEVTNQSNPSQIKIRPQRTLNQTEAIMCHQVIKKNYCLHGNHFFGVDEVLGQHECTWVKTNYGASLGGCDEGLVDRDLPINVNKCEDCVNADAGRDVDDIYLGDDEGAK